MLTARALRNRVLTILNRDDNMHEVLVTQESDTEDVTTDGVTYEPAIKFKQGTQEFLIIFREVKKK